MEDLLIIVARGGGGSSSGGGGGVGILGLIAVIIGYVITRHIRRKRIKKARSAQIIAMKGDHTWSNEYIQKRVSDVFYAFEKDWSEFNVKRMAHYLTPRYYQHMYLVMAALHQMGRKNLMENVLLVNSTLFGVHDHADDELDGFNVELTASAGDHLLGGKNGHVLHSTTSKFTEIWHFEREDSEWKLDRITQLNTDGFVTKFDPVIDEKFQKFADDHGFFYNADFGWLLMPQNGQLFSRASFGHSDINHHIIGAHHDRVVQLFEYVPLIQEKAKLRDHLRRLYGRRSDLAKYTVAQVTLPKHYGNIIVERRRLLLLSGLHPSNMVKVSLEWPRFNKLFDVFTTDREQATSLELLHPVYMEKLAGLKFAVNLEIVGDNLYLYSTDKKANYGQMLDLLKDAFKEMKM